MSSTVRLENASDYINPSNACIISLSSESSSRPLNESSIDIASPTIKAHKDKRAEFPDFNQPELSHKPQKASGFFETGPEETKLASKRIQVSLADCLACSGCITSAEEVLIQQHGTANLTRTLTDLLRKDNANLTPKILVATIAPQVIADMCVHSGDSDALTTFRRIFRFLTQSVGFHYVLSTEFAESVSSSMVGAEYVERVYDNQSGANPAPLPLLTSACPGFVCFIEKQQPALLPHLSRVMSQQSITGVIVDRLFGGSREDSTDPDKYLHVSIQPCFDRKLEASRETHALCTHFVLSTVELLDWMDEMNFGTDDWHDEGNEVHPLDWTTGMPNIDDIRGLDGSPRWILVRPDLPHALIGSMNSRESQNPAVSEWIHRFLSKNQLIPTAPLASEEDLAISGKMDGSGGYHRDVLISKWLQHHFSENPPPISCQNSPPSVSLHYRIRRNSNHQEVYVLDETQEAPSSETLQYLKTTDRFVTIMYGFQHIQNLTRGLKKGQSTKNAHFIANYSDFIEVMACPGGCLNGSAQSRRKRDSVHEGHTYLRAVEGRFHQWKSLCASLCHSNGAAIDGQMPSSQPVVLSLKSIFESCRRESRGVTQPDKETPCSPYLDFFTVYSTPSNTSTTGDTNFLMVNDVAW